VRGRRDRQHVRAGFGEQVTGHRDRSGLGLARDAEAAGDAAHRQQAKMFAVVICGTAPFPNSG
jgi:hypothetical protein